MCLTPTAHYLEYADWWNPIIAEPLHVELGIAKTGIEPGTGVVWNEAAIARYGA
jgi:mandelate racemase